MIKVIKVKVTRELDALDVDGKIFVADDKVEGDWRLGEFLLRNCGDEGWRFCGAGLDFRGNTPEDCLYTAFQTRMALAVLA